MMNTSLIPLSKDLRNWELEKASKKTFSTIYGLKCFESKITKGEDQCYVHYVRKMSFDSAVKACATLGARIITIYNEEHSVTPQRLMTEGLQIGKDPSENRMESTEMKFFAYLNKNVVRPLIVKYTSVLVTVDQGVLMQVSSEELRVTRRFDDPKYQKEELGSEVYGTIYTIVNKIIQRVSSVHVRGVNKSQCTVRVRTPNNAEQNVGSVVWAAVVASEATLVILIGVHRYIYCISDTRTQSSSLHYKDATDQKFSTIPQLVQRKKLFPFRCPTGLPTEGGMKAGDLEIYAAGPRLSVVFLLLAATSFPGVARQSDIGPRMVRTNRLATGSLADQDVGRIYQNRLLESPRNAPSSDANSYWDEIVTSLHSACEVMLVDILSVNKPLTIRGQTIEVVDRLTHLGSRISSDCSVTDEVNAQI
ncbi:hypothetical protein CLF_107418 [Clonorchis sinensis]|uniref:C-type lectin domain-containing protein n=1 Tax=Clonorchis sinensis TaxID=79923 RepID=G7YGS0_CLOSI|nr:hypothetical protein CLF_107418 [Clonorchis sinensis]